MTGMYYLIMQQNFVARNQFFMGFRNYRYELFISVRECSGFPFFHRDMCATHALSLQVPCPSTRNPKG